MNYWPLITVARTTTTPAAKIPHPALDKERTSSPNYTSPYINDLQAPATRAHISFRSGDNPVPPVASVAGYASGSSWAQGEPYPHGRVRDGCGKRQNFLETVSRCHFQATRPRLPALILMRRPFLPCRGVTFAPVFFGATSAYRDCKVAMPPRLTKLAATVQPVDGGVRQDHRRQPLSALMWKCGSELRSPTLPRPRFPGFARSSVGHRLLQRADPSRRGIAESSIAGRHNFGSKSPDQPRIERFARGFPPLLRPGLPPQAPRAEARTFCHDNTMAAHDRVLSTCRRTPRNTETSAASWSRS